MPKSNHRLLTQLCLAFTLVDAKSFCLVPQTPPISGGTGDVMEFSEQQRRCKSSPCFWTLWSSLHSLNQSLPLLHVLTFTEYFSQYHKDTASHRLQVTSPRQQHCSVVTLTSWAFPSYQEALRKYFLSFWVTSWSVLSQSHRRQGHRWGTWMSLSLPPVPFSHSQYWTHFC